MVNLELFIDETPPPSSQSIPAPAPNSSPIIPKAPPSVNLNMVPDYNRDENDIKEANLTPKPYSQRPVTEANVASNHIPGAYQNSNYIIPQKNPPMVSQNQPSNTPFEWPANYISVAKDYIPNSVGPRPKGGFSASQKAEIEKVRKEIRLEEKKMLMKGETPPKRWPGGYYTTDVNQPQAQPAAANSGQSIGAQATNALFNHPDAHQDPNNGIVYIPQNKQPNKSASQVLDKINGFGTGPTGSSSSGMKMTNSGAKLLNQNYGQPKNPSLSGPDSKIAVTKALERQRERMRERMKEQMKQARIQERDRMRGVLGGQGVGVPKVGGGAPMANSGYGNQPSFGQGWKRRKRRFLPNL